MEQKCGFMKSSTKLLVSKFLTSITDRKLWDKLLEEKTLDVPTDVEQIQQKT